MSKPEQDSPIEELEQRLDTPGADLSGTFSRAGFHREMHDAPTDWTHEHGTQGTILNRMRFTKKHKTLATWLFGAAVIFFLLALGTAAFFLTGNRNVLTADKIDIRVTGPTKIAAGEVLPLAIEIKNNNASTLQVADLAIEYPSGSRSAEDVSVPLLRVRMGLGDLSPGERAATTSSVIIFGEEGTKQNVVVSLEYRIAGSNAIFVKERAFTVEIDDSPVRLSVDAPTSLNSGNDMALTVTVQSNSSAPLEDVILKADYPFGFEFAGADPDPSFSETIWSLGDLEPHGKRTITLRGKLEGQDDEERIFRFEIGVAEQRGDFTDIGTSFSNTEHTVRIARPFVDLVFTVNGKAGEALVAQTGEDVELEIAWRNNLSDRLADAVLELTMEGEGVSEKTIKSQSGFYDSSKNTLTWDKRSVADFAVVEAGESGRVNVSFLVPSAEDIGGKEVNPEVRLSATLRGVPIGNNDTPELVKTGGGTTLKIVSDAGLDVTVLHGDGPLENSGPLPPRAETETTYTVVWDITSSVNDISNAQVTAKLPPYVKWKGVMKPSDEDVIYDPSTGLITWNVGTVRAGAGYGKSARSLAFQIGLTPSTNQIGSAPIVIEDATLKAADGFAGVSVGDTAVEQTTLLSKDKTFQQGDDRVKP
jgi:hypothetical protein